MTQINKLSQLLKQQQKIFHTQDLAVLWQIENKNTLYTAIKRLIQKGVLIPIHKGLYSVLPLSQLDPARLGASLIHSFTYLSMESVLTKEGVISQRIYPYTFVSSFSRKYTLSNYSYLFRRLKSIYLHNTTGIRQENEIFVASKERAAADMLYFNPKYYFDNPSLINWKKVQQIQKEVGYL